MGVTKRETNETSISVELLPEGAGVSGAIEQAASGKKAIDTGNPFLDHMLTAFARYSGLGLRVTARGDLPHHLIEDVAITLGRAFRDIVPAGAARYGNRVIPMDDALVQVSVDIGGRPFYEGPLPSGLYDHWMRSLSWCCAVATATTLSKPHSKRSASPFAMRSSIPATLSAPKAPSR